MAQSKISLTFDEGMKIACEAIVNGIKDYAEMKYDDYAIRDKITARERANNELARDVIEDLLKFLEHISTSIDEKAVEDKVKHTEEPKAEEVKENSNVGTDGNGEVSAEAVHGSRAGSEEEVSEVHAGLSKA